LALPAAPRHPARVRRSPSAAPLALLVALALVLAGCGGGGVGDGDEQVVGTEDSPVTEFTIVAEDIRFDLDRIVVPAGEEITATIDNRDSGIGHNLAVSLPDGEAATEIESGPVEQTLTFTVPEPGEYDFVCDPHPSTMEGVVEAV
jgi:plastocyanin